MTEVIATILQERSTEEEKAPGERENNEEGSVMSDALREADTPGKSGPGPKPGPSIVTGVQQCTMFFYAPVSLHREST